MVLVPGGWTSDSRAVGSSCHVSARGPRGSKWAAAHEEVGVDKSLFYYGWQIWEIVKAEGESDRAGCKSLGSPDDGPGKLFIYTC